MSSLTVEAAMRRSYTTGEAMAQDFVNGLDFRGTNPGKGMLGVLFSIRDLDSMGVNSLTLRYNENVDFVLCRFSEGVLTLQNDDLNWHPVEKTQKEKRTPGVGHCFCQCCGRPGKGNCKPIDCVEINHDSMVKAHCSHCGDEREVESDARGYGCHTEGCPGTLTSPFELMLGEM